MKQEIKGILEGGSVAMLIGIGTAFPSYTINDVGLMAGLTHAVLAFAGIVAYFLIRAK